jgi:hypothetical protein
MNQQQSMKVCNASLCQDMKMGNNKIDLLSAHEGLIIGFPWIGRAHSKQLPASCNPGS